MLGVKGHEQAPKQDTTSFAYNITRPWRVPGRYMQQYIRHLAILVRIAAVQTVWCRFAYIPLRLRIAFCLQYRLIVIGFEKRAHLERNLDFWVVTQYERAVSKLPVALCLEFVAASVREIHTFEV